MNPAVDTKTAVREQVNARRTRLLQRFRQLAQANPQPRGRPDGLQTLAKLGIVPGQDFDAAKLEPRWPRLSRRRKTAQKKTIWGGAQMYGVAAVTTPSQTAGCSPSRPGRTAQLSATRVHHRRRFGCQPAAGRGVPDLEGPSQGVKYRRQPVPAAISTRDSYRRW